MGAPDVPWPVGGDRAPVPGTSSAPCGRRAGRWPPTAEATARCGNGPRATRRSHSSPAAAARSFRLAAPPATDWSVVAPLDLLHGVQEQGHNDGETVLHPCLLYTSPSPRDRTRSRM